jgi:DNA damage-binding protein 1
LGTFNFETDEEVTALATLSPRIGDKSLPLFCLGTYIYEPDEKEPTKGKLRLFTAFSSASDLQLSLVTSADVKGCVYSLAIVGDTVVAAVNSSVSDTLPA